MAQQTLQLGTTFGLPESAGLSVDWLFGEKSDHEWFNSIVESNGSPILSAIEPIQDRGGEFLGDACHRRDLIDGGLAQPRDTAELFQ
jgi:hypothetical protein